jgi:hypothetical protein
MPIIPFKESAEQWRTLFEQLAPDLPTDFLIAWLDKESGGNPCSLGMTDPNKFEAGIFQTMHPNDDKFGATAAELRTGCNGQLIEDPSLVNYDLQASHGLNFVRAKVAAAQTHLFAAGVQWDQSSSDFWKAVKQEHALPCVMGDLLPRVVKRYGPPPDFGTFREQAMTFAPSETGSCSGFMSFPSVRGLRNRLEDTMQNAEETGKYGGGVFGAIGKLGKFGPFVMLGAAAGLLYLIWDRNN